MRNDKISGHRANRIRDVRQRRQLTLAQVAKKVRCSISQVSDLERGKRKLTSEWTRRIARALSVDPGDLLLAADDQEPADAREKELLLRYRFGSDEQRFMILAIARIINRVPL